MNNKKVFFTILFSLFLLLFAAFLPVQAADTVQGSQYISEISTCKYIVENDPEYETTSFTVWDEKVTCWIKINYFSSSEFVITWEWEDPSGNIYHTGSLDMEAGNYQNYRTWYEIGIRDRYAANLPGEWKIRIYFDDVVVAIKSFTIM